MNNRRDFQHQQDRFGGYSGSMNYGNPYESRHQQQNDVSRQNPWDEDRFGYPESNRYGRQTSRSQNPGYGPQGRFGEDRYSWGQQYGSGNHYEQPRRYEPRQSSSWDSSWGEGHSGRFAGSESFGGGMRGRTPKGYTRSDDRIKDDVCEQLYRTPDIDVSEVTVEARSGTVTLEGTVPDRRMKHRIEDLCEQCIGVQDVENRIRVQRSGPDASSRFDEDRGSMSTSSGTASASDRSNKKSTGTSSSQH